MYACVFIETSMLLQTSDQLELDITEDDPILDDLDCDEKCDWLNHADSNISYEEVSLCNEHDTIAATEGKKYYW